MQLDPITEAFPEVEERRAKSATKLQHPHALPLRKTYLDILRDAADQALEVRQPPAAVPELRPVSFFTHRSRLSAILAPACHF